MDGARISNAAIALDCSLYDMTGGSGVDILSFGGTKNGMMYGEAVVFFDPAQCIDFKYRRKQGMQLASKMRYIAAQFNAFLQDDLWKENASHANRMAEELYAAVRDIKGVEITQQVQSNAVFALIPKEVIPKLQEHYFFYVWDEERSEVRWMCSYDTTREDIDGFAGLLKSLMSV
jgi:threonine aldolase